MIGRKVLSVFSVILLLGISSGCSVLNQNANISIVDDPAMAMKQIAGEHIRTYGTEQKALLKEIQRIKQEYDKMTNALSGNVAKQWGNEDVTLPSASTYVRYSNHYKSKASIDFMRGIIRIETLESKNPAQSLQKAIVNTLLLPQDPSKVDLYSDDDLKFDGKPFLAGLIKDQDGQDILYEWRAQRFAQYLTQNVLKTRSNSKGQTISYVEIKMDGNYQNIAENKYEAIVQKYAKKYNVPASLILAIIQTESNFNPYAVSNAPAYGLMQIVPSTAGRDAYELVNGKKGTPTKEMLFNPETNIEYGTAYLSILFTRYLGGVRNTQSQEYCVITAYNAGAGSVLRTFHADKNTAISRINTLSPSKIYDTLRTKLDSQEGRRYLLKVTTNKQNYTHIK